MILLHVQLLTTAPHTSGSWEACASAMKCHAGPSRNWQAATQLPALCSAPHPASLRPPTPHPLQVRAGTGRHAGGTHRLGAAHRTAPAGRTLRVCPARHGGAAHPRFNSPLAARGGRPGGRAAAGHCSRSRRGGDSSGASCEGHAAYCLCGLRTGGHTCLLAHTAPLLLPGALLSNEGISYICRVLALLHRKGRSRCQPRPLLRQPLARRHLAMRSRRRRRSLLGGRRLLVTAAAGRQQRRHGVLRSELPLLNCLTAK